MFEKEKVESEVGKVLSDEQARLEIEDRLCTRYLYLFVPMYGPRLGIID